ncbi:phage major capsid protein [Rhizobium sp. Leaf383]|uniref:phage major capsid protein n=1 Tax=Rhizobium sp. Leaf383 TaxID=1736357 RepID=UPI00071556E4|nr:phage major capsid protein [Rhizobium sp. Leaf383]KQS86946.1 capsid protein [Rhizobium sp. Leaf383]
MKNMLLMASAAAILGPMTPNERRAGRYLRDGGGHPTAEQLAGQVKAKFDSALDAVKAIADEALGKAKSGEAMSTSMKEKADEALVKLNEVSGRLGELEQKMVRDGENGPEVVKTAGYQMIENDDVKSFAKNPISGKRIGVEVKAIISAATADANGSAGALLEPQRVGMVTPVTRRMTIRDLLTPGRTSQPSIQYPRETGFTNNAATVSEVLGLLKPQSDIKFDIKTVSVTTIAHWVLATRQILDDLPMLQSYIDGRLRYGLSFVEENQLLNGGGTGTDLLGIYPQATAFAAGAAIVQAPTRIDVIRYAMLQGALAELPATGITMNPIDWAMIETTKDAGNNYVIGDPQKSAQPSLWSLPVVPTQAMASGTFLTGAFQLGAQIFDREDARVEISTEDADNFRKNLVTILAEERLALAVYRPEAFIKGTFAAGITDLTS